MTANLVERGAARFGAPVASRVVFGSDYRRVTVGGDVRNEPNSASTSLLVLQSQTRIDF